MSPPAERLAAWIQSQGWTRDVAAERLGFGRDMLDSILRDRRMPGRLLANTIERQSAPWEHGPIRSVEWDAVEIARKRKRESGQRPADPPCDCCGSAPGTERIDTEDRNVTTLWACPPCKRKRHREELRAVGVDPEQQTAEPDAAE